MARHPADRAAWCTARADGFDATDIIRRTLTAAIVVAQPEVQVDTLLDELRRYVKLSGNAARFWVLY
jgi:hypothetical protein